MNISFERVTMLEYRLKAVEAQLRAFRSGEALSWNFYTIGFSGREQ